MPMGNVVSTIQYNSILFKKDNILFCKINNDKIYLMDDIHAFRPVNSHILKNPDEFLQEATKAYWIAAGNHTK
jgi:hypothetical protein